MSRRHWTEIHKVPHAGGLNPEDWCRFIEMPYFSAKWRRLGLADADLRALQIMLTMFPKQAPVVAGTGGLRKVRFASPNRRRGKSGSFRVGYAYYEAYGCIALITVYAKSDQGNLSRAERNEIGRLLEKLEQWIAGGA